jgi:uncharacterized membrane protein AbrB (regulator of aidB expression)
MTKVAFPFPKFYSVPASVLIFIKVGTRLTPIVLDDLVDVIVLTIITTITPACDFHP